MESNDMMKRDGSQMEELELTGHRMMSLEQIDYLHKVPDGSAARSFRKNNSQFQEGEDFFYGGPRGKCAFTEAGYLKIIFTFNDDLALKARRQCVDAFVRARQEPAAKAMRTAQEHWMDIGTGIDSADVSTPIAAVSHSSTA
jgi:hypothetical protein